MMASELEPGIYVVGPELGMNYVPDQVWSAEVKVPGEDPSTISVQLPPALELDLPKEHAPNTPLELDLSSHDYTGAAVVVLDSTGAITTSSTISASAKFPVKHIPIAPTPGPPHSEWAWRHSARSQSVIGLDSPRASTLNSRLMQARAIPCSTYPLL